ncbi:WD40 repeat-like protein [Hysterangium stoloniferum]|nr:WD40 repeat-like protein [Hysterangium stoloniferum]
MRRHCPTEGRYSRNSLDKVAVLGEHDDPGGHSGCVNALHWSADGSVLLSAGDDTRVHFWRLDSAQGQDAGDYPLTCTAMLQTGHTNNIFNVQILGNSSRIATCAADRQVRVFDIHGGDLYRQNHGLTKYTKEQACIRTLRCHRDRVKRIITENSPDYFLTVSEDGTVRQHDLRTPHKCSRKDEACPSPLLRLPFSLSTIALSPLTPYNFVVAGDSPYGYLFDRRQPGRRFKEEWGAEGVSNDLTSCVRRFGRKPSGKKEYLGGEHITGSRMSNDNGHELLLSYSGDAVYLYSTRDSPEESLSQSSDVSSSDGNGSGVSSTEDGPDALKDDLPDTLRLPIVVPRQRYHGACNMDTVKDVNFLGPKDNYVVSGSDDGNFFIWDKLTGGLRDILEGDESIVNVIEQHPSLPVLAVSGIDSTVKIFAPSGNVRNSSRISQKEEIMQNNMSQEQSLSMMLHAEMSRHRVVIAGETLADEPECVYQ